MPVNTAEINFFKELETEQKDSSFKSLQDLSIAEYREMASLFSKYIGQPEPVEYTDTTCPARDGFAIPVRIYNNYLEQKSPVIIFYPGCGYIIDLFEANATICSRIAKRVGVKVIAINHRLAPEHPLPGPIYDLYDATQFIATHDHKFNIDPDKIFLCGLSSGANAAAVVANLTRNDHTFNIYRQVLLSGIYDLNRATHGFDDYEKEDKLLTMEALDYMYNQACPNVEDRTNPLFSSYYEKNLTGLPPTTIIVAEYDGARNDSEAYFNRLKEAGNDVEKIVMPGQTHNTVAMRTVLSDGIDPAEIMSNVIIKHMG